MSKLIDRTGQKHFRLTAIKHIEGNFWLFRCDCGNEKILNVHDVFHGKTKSCGCLNAELAKKHCLSMSKHGMYQTKEYRAWHAMKDRCNCPTNKFYDYYGGRGITICNEWQNSFENFFEDMGYAPTKIHSLDRIDNNKGYSKENCRWATKKEQVTNRRNTIFLTYDGETKPLSVWADEYNLSYNVLQKRINIFKWDIEKSLKTPTRPKRKNIKDIHL